MNVDLFEKAESTVDSCTGQYRLFSPDKKDSACYPMVVILSDEAELPASAAWFAEAQLQKAHPCFVLVPESPARAGWDSAESDEFVPNLIRNIMSKYPVDPNRIYIHGIGGGAMGTYRMIAKNPYLFAAALPVNGFGDPHEMRPAKNVPVWAFHTAENPAIDAGGPVFYRGKSYLAGSRNLVAALKSAGNTSVKYTEFSGEADAQDTALLHKIFSDGKAIEWLYAQRRTLQYVIEMIMPGVFVIDDYSDATFYLIEGRDKALVIDTGMGEGNMRELAESLTPLPVELAITHAHGDHFLHACEFDKVYMHPRDIAILPQMKAMFAKQMVGRDINPETLVPVEEGSVIDLGGGVKITVLEIAGHTPGSVAFVDPKHGVIASGDAIGSGSGVWMQVQMAVSIREYRENLLHFSKKLKEYDHLLFLGGHRLQDGSAKNSPMSMGRVFYNPLTAQTVEDMAALCEMLLNGKIEGEPYPINRFGEPAYIATYRTASLVHNKSQIK